MLAVVECYYFNWRLAAVISYNVYLHDDDDGGDSEDDVDVADDNNNV